jgi:hypothetical protein
MGRKADAEKDLATLKPLKPKLASIPGHTDLDLRFVSHLHRRGRTECRSRRWSAQKDLLRQTFFGGEADIARSQFEPS